MKYDISSQKAPAMPNPGTGTECIKMLLSQASKDMREPLVPMFFPVLGTHQRRRISLTRQLYMASLSA